MFTKLQKTTITGLMIAVFALGTFVPQISPVERAQAQTTSELQAQINALLAQITALQAQLSGNTGSTGGNTTVSGVCPFNWNRNITIGTTGEDVRMLQKFLNASADTRIAVSGVGSAGFETTTFGPLTRAAVIKFQEKHRATVLTPSGLITGTGYVGPSTRARLNALCVSSTPNPTPSPDPEEKPSPTPKPGSEGDITDFDVLSKYSNEELAGGDTDKVFGFEFEADGSDLRVSRLDILFEANADAPGTNDRRDAKPWNFVETLKLYADGKVVATVSGKSESNWAKVASVNMDGEGDDDTYRVRFSGLDVKVKKGDRTEYVLEVVTRSVLDSGRIPQNFEIAVANDGIRAVDTAGINIYGGSSTSNYQVTVTFTNLTAGQLDLSGSDDFDKSVSAKASATSATNNIVIGMFEMEADDQDIEIQDLPVDLVIVGSDVDNLVTRLGLYVGNTLIKSKTVSSSGASTTITFNDIDYTIKKDKTVTFTLKADVAKLDGTTDQTEGISVYASVYGAQIVAEDANGDDVTVDGNWNTGSNPYTVSFYTKLPSLELVSTSEVRGAATSNGVVTSGSYTVKFSLKAVGGDVYVPATAVGTTTSSSAGSSDAGIEYLVSASGGTASTSGMSAVVTATGATKVTSTTPNLYKINNGQTATFTLTVNYNNAGNTQSGFYDVQIIGLNWDVDQDTTPDHAITFGFDSFETGSLFLSN